MLHARLGKNGSPNFRHAQSLVGIPRKPRRSWLPIGNADPLIADRHLDLRQIILVEGLVLRDYLVDGEQVSRQRIYLIGGKSPLIPERHAAMDEIPHDNCIRRLHGYAVPPRSAIPGVNLWA